MKISIRTKGIDLSAKDRTQVEKRISRLKKYFDDEAATVDVYFIQESGEGGNKKADIGVHLNAVMGKEKFFIEEVDDQPMRAFAFAYHRFKRIIERYHRRKVDEATKPAGKLDSLFRMVRRSR